MKAVLIPNLVEYHAVSMKRYAQELTRALLALSPSDWEFESLTCHQVEEAIKVFPGKLGHQMADRLGRFVRYPALVRRAHGDLYHVLDHSHAHLIKELPVKRTIVSCHDVIPLLAAQGKLDFPVGRLTRYNFPRLLKQVERCPVVITLSEASKADIIANTTLRPEQVHPIYLGISPVFSPEPGQDLSLDQERTAIRRQYKIPDDALVMVHVGTTGRYKNTPALVRLLHSLRHSPELGSRIWLLRIGAPLEPEVVALAESSGVRDRLVQAGRLATDEELAAHYRASDVLVFPSLWEGFGWPPLEAMACGTPAVVSNVGSLPEVAGSVAITVSPTDDPALAEAVGSLLQDRPRYEKVRTESIAWARSFTWERTARQTLALYETLR